MASAPSDHERFYFSDGSLSLVVEDSLYRVHRSLFELHATKFPPCEHGTFDGEIHFLKDVKKVDFDRLLACLYPRALFVEEAETTEEWMSILKLASIWGFETLRTMAISKVEQTLASPVDVVVFGRQYGISNIFLSGYVTLCQGTTPLSSEEGRRLGVDDVINIYRVRHELQDSLSTPVSPENVLEKVRGLFSNEGQEDKQDTETERPDSDLDDEQSNEWTDGASITTSPISLASSVPLLFSRAPVDVNGSGSQVFGFSSEQQQTISDVFFSTEGLEAQTTQPVFGQWHADLPLSSYERCQPFDKLHMKNFGPLSDDIIQWIQARSDDERLHYIMRMTVERAMEEPKRIDACVLLFKKMVTNLKGKFQHMGKSVKGKTLVRRYLIEICRDNLVVTAASVAATNRTGNDTFESLSTANCPAKVRRLRLIEFIAKLSRPTSNVIKSRVVVNKWIASLLDVYDEEKLATLCLLLTKAGPGWDTSNKKLRACMDSCFQKMADLAQKTSNSRIQTLLQDMIRCREQGWVAT